MIDVCVCERRIVHDEIIVAFSAGAFVHAKVSIMFKSINRACVYVRAKLNQIVCARAQCNYSSRSHSTHFANRCCCRCCCDTPRVKMGVHSARARARDQS